MNPEENQSQTPAAGPAPEPATPSDASAPAAEPAGPVLDSDVANAINELASAAAAAGGEPASTAATDTTSTPAAEPVPTPTGDTSTPAASPTAPAPEVVAFDDLASTDASAPAATPITVAEPAATDPAPAAAPAETPASTTGAPAPDVAAAITELDADAVIDSIDSPDTTPESSIPTAIGVDTVASGNAVASPSSSVDENNDTSVFDAPAETSFEGSEDGESSEGGAKILSSDDDDKKEEEPIEPAEPVPGSIGSALKYSATAPDHSEPTEKPKGLAALFAKKPKKAEATANAEPTQSLSAVEEPTRENTNSEVPVSFGPAPDVPNPNVAKGKKNSTILALIIIGAVVLVGAIVAIVVFIMTSNDNKVTVTKTNPATAAPDPEDTSLICSYTSTADDIARTQNNKLASYDLKMIANYTDDEMIDMSVTGTYNYTDADAASEGARQARTSYTRDYTKLSINADPFTSSYPVSGNSFTATHFAKFDEINESNAKLLFLNVTNGSVDTSKDAVREVFTKKGYSCRDAGGSQEDDTEIIEDEEAVVMEDENAGTEIDDTIEADEEVDEPRNNSSNSANKNSSSSSNKNSNTVGGNGDKEEEIDEDSY